MNAFFFNVLNSLGNLKVPDPVFNLSRESLAFIFLLFPFLT